MDSTLTLTPIGFIRTQKHVKFQSMHQPAEGSGEQNILDLILDHGYEQALQDIGGFERIWLIWWFHRNATWRPLVLPPRGPSQRRGVFATRSPHRPNPLGMTPVRLIAVEKSRLILGPCDLVDGTPIFDIKPYVPAYDSFPTAKAGWIEEVDASLRQPPRFTVAFSETAQTQARWLREKWKIDFSPRLVELLGRDPSPHRTRRITRHGESKFVIGCGAWKAVFSVRDEVVTVLAMEPGYPVRFLIRPGYEDIPDREAQLMFREHWSDLEK